jgi:hypothetical protein
VSVRLWVIVLEPAGHIFPGVPRAYLAAIDPVDAPGVSTVEWSDCVCCAMHFPTEQAAADVFAVTYRDARGGLRSPVVDLIEKGCGILVERGELTRYPCETGPDSLS